MGALKNYIVVQLGKRKKKPGLNWKIISRDTGINYYTLGEIHRGRIKNPGLDSIEILIEYFKNHPIKTISQSK